MSELMGDLWCGMGNGKRFLIGTVPVDLLVGYHRKGAVKIGMVVYGSSDTDVKQKIGRKYPAAEIAE